MHVKARDNYTVEITNEGHTLLNILRWSIDRFNSDIELVGYTIPHPMEDRAILRVQFKEAGRQSKEEVLKKVREGLEIVEGVIASIIEKVAHSHQP